MQIRYPWLRALALFIGLMIFVGHTFTYLPSAIDPKWFAVNLRDIIYHFSALFLFAAAYRLSYTPKALGAGIATVIFCSGWGAMCEFAQLAVPTRHFSLIELAVNITTPLLIVGLLRLIRLR